MKSCLYKYIFGLLLTGEYLLKFKMIRKLPKCCMCNKGVLTTRHIFLECEEFVDAHMYLQDDIKDIGSDEILDNIIYGYGDKTKKMIL